MDREPFVRRAGRHRQRATAIGGDNQYRRALAAAQAQAQVLAPAGRTLSSRRGARAPRSRAPRRAAPSGPGTSAAHAGSRPGRPGAAGGARPSRGSRSRRSTTAPAKYSWSARRRSITAYRRRVSAMKRSRRVAAIGGVVERDEVMHLAGYRPEAAHLEHQPLEHRHARDRVARPEQAGLLAQVDQDRARLEHADRAGRPGRRCRRWPGSCCSG